MIHLTPLPPDEELLNQTLEALPFGVRTLNAFKAPDLEGKPYVGATVGELIAQSADQLMLLPNFGRVSLGETRAVLAAYGLHLHGEALPAPPAPSIEQRLAVIESKLDQLLARKEPQDVVFTLEQMQGDEERADKESGEYLRRLRDEEELRRYRRLFGKPD